MQISDGSITSLVYITNCVQVPFGEVSAVRNWLYISGVVNKPNPEHPKRPVCGFDCTRSEVLTLQFYVSSVMLLCGRFICWYHCFQPCGVIADSVKILLMAMSCWLCGSWSVAGCIHGEAGLSRSNLCSLARHRPQSAWCCSADEFWLWHVPDREGMQLQYEIEKLCIMCECYWQQQQQLQPNMTVESYHE